MIDDVSLEGLTEPQRDVVAAMRIRYDTATQRDRATMPPEEFGKCIGAYVTACRSRQQEQHGYFPSRPSA